MNCRFNKILLSRFCDGQTLPGQTQEIEAHLAICPECLRELEELRKLDKLFRKLPQVKTSVDYEIKFQRRLEERLKGKERYSPLEVALDNFRKGLNRLNRILAPVPVLARVSLTLVLLIGLGYVGTQLSERSFLSVMTVKGKIETYQAKEGQWQVAEVDKRIREGEIIRTGEHSFMDIELSRAYKLRIKDNTELRIARLVTKGRGAKTCLALNRGRILVDIGPGFKGKEFKVETPSGIAIAYGTEFSVEVDPKDKRMWLGVLEGEVGVSSHNKAPMILVKAKEKTEVLLNESPKLPLPLTAEELEILKEIERIGKLLVSLVLSDTPRRVKELLDSPRFYSYGKEPQEVQKILSEAVMLLNEAIRGNDRIKHLKVIARLEEANARYKEAEFNAHLLVFIGAYYEWLSLHKEAMERFREVAKRYRESEMASIAECAIGIIEERLGSFSLARESYQKVLAYYPQSLEVVEAKNGLERLELQR